MTISAGRLRHRIKFQKYDYVIDSGGNVIQDPVSGETVKRWIDVESVWAAIEPISAREFIQSSAFQSSVSARIIVRVPSEFEITADMRIVHSRIKRPVVIYNIHGVFPDPDSGLDYITMPVSTGS